MHDALKATIRNLRPGHSRVFVRKNVDSDAPEGTPAKQEFTALMRTLDLAEQAGANVNLTWWQGPYANEQKLAALKWPADGPAGSHASAFLARLPQQLAHPEGPGGIPGPQQLMERFARVIAAVRAGRSCVTHVTIQNEVNLHDIAKQNKPVLSMRLYELLYRRLAEALRRLPDPNDPSPSLRDAVQLVGGDLVEHGKSHQDDWLAYMHANMDDVLDGYSIHVYWAPEEFPDKPFGRLDRLQKTIERLSRAGTPFLKPIYVTGYGVRRTNANPKPGTMDGTKDGVPIELSPETAFQHGWFNAVAPQYGCIGLAKWVLYRTDKTKDFGHWGMIDAGGSPKGSFHRSHTYTVTRLFNHLVEPGAKAAGLARDPRTGLLASKFVGPDGRESVVVLNPGARPQHVRLKALRAQTTYFAADWHRSANPALLPLSPITTDGKRRATVTVPGHGIVALSTRALEL